MKASHVFKKGTPNVINQEWQADGSVIVTIKRHEWSRAYRFRAKNLYRENEEILEDEDVKEGGD